MVRRQFATIGRDRLTSEAFELLRRSGVRFAGGDLDAVSLVLQGERPRMVTRSVRVWSHALSRVSGDDRMAGVLHVAVVAGSDVVGAARAGDFDLITLRPPRVVIDGDEVLVAEDGEDEGGVSAVRRGRRPWGRWAIERVLILAGGRPLAQKDIAGRAGVTAPAVSQALSGHRLVRRVGEGWVADDGLVDRWLAEYPGPGGVVTHWFGLADPVEQAAAASDLAAELGTTSLITGDAAADRVAPWRRPVTARLYLSEFVDFVPAGFTPASAEEATMTAVVATDPTIVATADAAAPGSRRFADSALVLWDLTYTSSGADRDEAALKLRRAIVLGSARGLSG